MAGTFYEKVWIRKVHLYDAMGFRESTKLAAGSSITKPTKFPTCYDLRFRSVFCKIMADSFVQGKSKEEHWITLNRARAIENGCYMISPDHVGNIYCGRSLVVDPLQDFQVKCGMANINRYVPHDLERSYNNRSLLLLHGLM